MFAGMVLAFDLAASQAYADLMAKARSAGRAVSASDGYIAAIPVANRMMVATRDTSPFEAAGLKTVDPWEVWEIPGWHRRVIGDSDRGIEGGIHRR